MDYDDPQAEPRCELPRWMGGPVKPGIDINDTSEVVAMLDEGRDLEALRW